MTKPLPAPFYAAVRPEVQSEYAGQTGHAQFVDVVRGETRAYKLLMPDGALLWFSVAELTTAVQPGEE